MSANRMSRLFIVLVALTALHGNAAAEAYCKKLTGHGQGYTIVQAADGARFQLWRRVYAQFGVRPVRHRIPGLINRQFACHESRRSGRVVHHCRVSGTMCRVEGVPRIQTDTLQPRRF